MIDIGFNCLKNFETQYEKLQKEHGTYIARLNGFDDRQLSYTDFIDNFIDKDTVADASIDSSSNVSHKDIVTLFTEMPKPHRKLIAFNKIYYEYEKMFGFHNANEWLDMEWTGKTYLHDADSSTGKSYCFSGDTEILTNYGVKPLVECLGYPIKVLNKNHGWEDAEVQYFGRQPLMQITLERFGAVKNIRVTPNHRWFVKEYKKGIKTTFIKQTYELQPGDKIPFNTSSVWAHVEPSPFGVAHGFFTGDGKKGDIRVANFCGDKVSLLPYFTPANITGSEREFNTRGIPEYFNHLPTLNESPSYLYGWLSGYFAADGCVDIKGRCTIASTEYENLQRCRDILCILGMPVNDIRYQDRISNLTGEMGRVYVLTLSDEYLKDDFFIRPQHKERIIANKNKNRKNRDWIVKSVINLGIEEDVFCAVVPGTQSFTLTNNILTHNCFAYTLKDLAEKGLFFIDNFNNEPPKHLITFVDFVKEFISFTSNRTSGAVGLPDLLIYMFYFWKKDVENHYMGMDEEIGKKYAEQNFQRFIYAVNQPYVRDGQQSAFTNTSIFDRPYFEALFGGVEYPDGTFVIDYEEEIMEFQKQFMKVMSNIRNKNMFTYPINSISLLRKEGKYDLDSLDGFVDQEFARWAILHNMIWADSNLFWDVSVNSLSNCCRLKSDIRDLGYFNSIGGTALKVGSVKVSTINLARIALDTNSEEEYLEELAHRTLVNIRVLHVVRHIIKRNVDKKLLPNFTYGLIDFEHLYNTIGFIGIYETMKKFGYIRMDELGNTYYTDEAAAFGEKIFKTMRAVADKFIADNKDRADDDILKVDYMINTEQIPGESAADKLMKKDKFFYPDADIYDLPLYGNQFIPLGIQTTLQERVRIQAMFDKFCNGGSILHCNIDAPFDSFEKALRMANYIAQAGVTYCAFNTKIQVCKDNHAFYGDICPECGKPVDSEYTRIVGFLTKIKTWSSTRKAEFKLRKWEKINYTAEAI